jgi:hypothetical protein
VSEAHRVIRKKLEGGGGGGLFANACPHRPGRVVGHGARKDPWREHFEALGWRCWRVEASCRAGHSEDCQCTGDVGFGGRLAVGEWGGGPRRFEGGCILVMLVVWLLSRHPTVRLGHPGWIHSERSSSGGACSLCEATTAWSTEGLSLS